MAMHKTEWWLHRRKKFHDIHIFFSVLFWSFYIMHKLLCQLDRQVRREGPPLQINPFNISYLLITNWTPHLAWCPYLGWGSNQRNRCKSTGTPLLLLFIDTYRQVCNYTGCFFGGPLVYPVNKGDFINSGDFNAGSFSFEE